MNGSLMGGVVRGGALLREWGLSFKASRNALQVEIPLCASASSALAPNKKASRANGRIAIPLVFDHDVLLFFRFPVFGVFSGELIVRHDVHILACLVKHIFERDCHLTARFDGERPRRHWVQTVAHQRNVKLPSRCRVECHSCSYNAELTWLKGNRYFDDVVVARAHCVASRLEFEGVARNCDLVLGALATAGRHVHDLYRSHLC
mmetsp:Transcript_11727/g.30118  ORF Transcript_11727/g.30118 Transcript_11727/m.30118 type:complete len:205 (+) Transcript_11727:1440-2054(+)